MTAPVSPRFAAAGQAAHVSRTLAELGLPVLRTGSRASAQGVRVRRSEDFRGTLVSVDLDDLAEQRELARRVAAELTGRGYTVATGATPAGGPSVVWVQKS